MIPNDFATASDEGWRHVRDTPGYLFEPEARFLMLAAIAAPVAGAIVEIGSFKGRSTVGLAYIAQRYRLGKVIAVDPHTSPSTTDPDLLGQPSSFDDFQMNLRRAGVAVAIPRPASYCGTDCTGDGGGGRGDSMPEQLIGTVVHYFKGPSVAVVRVTEGTLAVGESVRFHGHTTDFTEPVASMEVNHEKVLQANVGDEVAIKVKDRVRQHDQVFKVTP